MLVLGVETSCDETALALLEFQNKQEHKVLSELVSSQIEIHKDYGGVVPELASREHLQNIPLLLDKLLKESNAHLSDIDLFAVTSMPGLLGCLLVGLGFIKGVVTALNKPFIAVDHIEAHLLSVFLTSKEVNFPFLGVVVSGGHSEIYLVEGFGRYLLVSKTLDDAAGEAFDKCGALLDLPYPGGPLLAKLAAACRTRPSEQLPLAMKSDINFSFAGLKTAAALLVKRKREEGELSREEKASLAYAIQEAITETIALKIKQALEIHPVSTVVVTGGVACNQRLREKASQLPVKAIFPPKKYCTDNASMVAFAGYHGYILKGASPLTVPAKSRRW